MKLSVEQWIGLIQFGLSTASQIHAAFAKGHASIVQPAGTVVTGDAASAALDGAIAAALVTGDAEAARILNRTPPQ